MWNLRSASKSLSRRCPNSDYGGAVELFVRYRGQMADAAVEALVVPPIDPPGSSEFHIGKRPKGAFVEDVGADGPGLEQSATWDLGVAYPG